MKQPNPTPFERFKTIRKELRYRQSEFAELLQIKTSTADIERGKTKIPGHAIMLLMKKFSVNPLWVYGESNEKFIKPKTDVSPKVISLNDHKSENILLVNQKAQAGYATNIQDSKYYESLPAFSLPMPEFRNATYRGFQVEGDSMLPDIRPNEWVIGKAVTSVEEIIDNRVYVVILKDSVMVKSIKKIASNTLQLISFNDYYSPFNLLLTDIQELWLVNAKISFGIEDPNSLLFRQLHESMKDLRAQLEKLKS